MNFGSNNTFSKVVPFLEVAVGQDEGMMGCGRRHVLGYRAAEHVILRRDGGRDRGAVSGRVLLHVTKVSVDDADARLVIIVIHVSKIKGTCFNHVWNSGNGARGMHPH